MACNKAANLQRPLENLWVKGNELLGVVRLNGEPIRN